MKFQINDNMTGEWVYFKSLGQRISLTVNGKVIVEFTNEAQVDAFFDMLRAAQQAAKAKNDEKLAVEQAEAMAKLKAQVLAERAQVSAWLAEGQEEE